MPSLVFRVVSLAVVLAALSVPMHAQQAGAPPSPPAFLRTGDPLAAVGLTASQRKTVNALSTTFRSKQQEMSARQKAGVPVSAADQAAMWQLGEAHNTAIRAVLTPAQRTTLDAWIAQRRTTRIAEGRMRFAQAHPPIRPPFAGAGATTPSPITAPNAPREP